jgi:hypothetical protein
MKIGTLLIVSVSAALLLIGCGDNTMSQAEIDKAKNSPKMTDEDRARVAAGMAAGGAAAKQSQQEWADKNPEELARVNAERAKMGRPPLGK